MRRLLLIVTIVALITTGCADKVPKSYPFANAIGVGTLAGTPDGGLVYGIRTSGAVYQVDVHGTGGHTPFTTIAIGTAGDSGLTGLTTDAQGRVFAAWTDPAEQITVGQIAPGSTRIVWRGPTATGKNTSGRLATTPDGRLLLAVGDLGDASKAANPAFSNGKLLTIDPNSTADQQPNAISTGWHDPTGVAYSADNVLWVADQRVLARAGNNGPTAPTTSLPAESEPIAMSRYGDATDQELTVCFANSGKLLRYSLNDGQQALPGRTLARDCRLGVAELKDGRLVYASQTGLEVTAL